METDNWFTGIGKGATKMCQRCGGKGFILLPNGPEDVDKEMCPNCEGGGVEFIF